MKNSVLILGVVLVTAFCGCKRESAESKSSETLVFGPEFSAKSGLRVPDDTRQSLGLRTVEVSEKNVPTSIDFEARVYKTEQTSVFVSGTITPGEAENLKVGQQVQIQFSPEKRLTGKISAIKRELEKTTGLTEALVEVPNAKGTTVGTFVRASAKIESEEDVVTIPRTALLECSDGFSVYTVNGEHFMRTPVKIGATTGEDVEIKDGLYAGDEVVLQPVLSLWMTELAAVKGGQACCAMPGEKK